MAGITVMVVTQNTTASIGLACRYVWFTLRYDVIITIALIWR